MKLAMSLPKGDAETLGNAMRQIALACTPSWRPAGFSLDRTFNMLNSTDEVVEDMITVMSNLTMITLIPKRDFGNTEFLKESFTFKGSLSAENMKSEYFDLVGLEGNVITLLDDQPATLTLVYRFSAGRHETLENTAFINNHGELASKYKALSSRHAGAEEFTFDVEQRSLKEEMLIITVKSDVANEEDILVSSAEKLLQSVHQVLGILKQKPAEKYQELEPVTFVGAK
jgi:DNA-directed RNA polymerase alpha subunit